MRPHSINLAATIKPKTVTRTCSVLVLSASLAFIASAIVLSKHVRRASEHCKLQVLQALQSSIAEHCIAARRMSVARAGVVAGYLRGRRCTGERRGGGETGREEGLGTVTCAEGPGSSGRGRPGSSALGPPRDGGVGWGV